MCTSMIEKSLRAPLGWSGKVANKGGWLDPASEYWRKQGFAGDKANLEHQLGAWMSGEETATNRRAREMGEQAQEEVRLSKTYHGPSVHSQNVARRRAGPTVVPIAGRGGAL